MVLEALSHDLRIGLPWEVLCTNDLVLAAENGIYVAEKLRRLRKGMESWGLRINTVKTKVIHVRPSGCTVIAVGVWLCAVC